MNISVCLATYNGEKFIIEQLSSIIRQLDANDEIIIVDDCSTDRTIEAIQSVNDSRIKIYFNHINKGHVFSFGRAISLTTKDYIFMSDQDDIWIDDRLQIMLDRMLSSNVLLLSSNTNYINSDGNKIDFSENKLKPKRSNKYLSNIIDILLGKGYYYGCAMAFKKEFKKIILPIPEYVESHDLWIALAANIYKSNLHLNESTLNRRVHGANASIVKRKIIPKLFSRLIFIKSIIELYQRKQNRKKSNEK